MPDPQPKDAPNPFTGSPPPQSAYLYPARSRVIAGPTTEIASGTSEHHDDSVPSLDVSSRQPHPQWATGNLPRSDVQAELIDSFKQWSAAEKLRMSERQRSILRESKVVKLDDLKKFSKNFRLQTTMPKDIQELLKKSSVEDSTPTAPTVSPAISVPISPPSAPRIRPAIPISRLQPVTQPDSERSEDDVKHGRENETKIHEAQKAAGTEERAVEAEPNAIATGLVEVVETMNNDMGSIAETRSSDGTLKYGSRSTTAGGSISTRPTTVSDFTNSKLPSEKNAITQERIIEDPERDQKQMESQHELETETNSTISGGSVVFHDAEERDMVIKNFANALLKSIPNSCLQPGSRPLDNPAFYQSFSSHVKAYSKEVRMDTPRGSRSNQASKAIRQLRRQILSKLQESLSASDKAESSPKILTSISRQLQEIGDAGNATPGEKFQDWKVSINPMESLEPFSVSADAPVYCFNDVQEAKYSVENPPGNSSVSSVGVNEDQDLSHIANLEDQDIYSYLIGHQAFVTLARNLRAIFEQYFGNQLDLIGRRISLVLRRSGMIEQSTDGIFCATFRTEWDAARFLRDQYESGVMQPLRQVLALTGEAVDAQLTTVELYLRQCWPKYTYALVDAISSTLQRSNDPKRSMSSCCAETLSSR
jgi:hypothetical protein